MKLSKILAMTAGAVVLSATIVLAAPATTVLEAPVAEVYNPLAGADVVIQEDFSTDTFRKVLVTADLEDMIKYDATGAGFTIFIPTDRAMENDLSPERVAELMTDKKAARYFVMFHMLGSKKTIADLQALSGTEINSMSKTPLLMTTVKGTRGDWVTIVNGAAIQSGVYRGNHNINIYIVDAVVTP